MTSLNIFRIFIEVMVWRCASALRHFVSVGGVMATLSDLRVILAKKGIAYLQGRVGAWQHPSLAIALRASGPINRTARMGENS
jgi:hypothetical protein